MTINFVKLLKHLKIVENIFKYAFVQLMNYNIDWLYLIIKYIQL